MIKIAVFAALFALCAADTPPYPAAYQQPSYDVAAVYNFDWAVKDDPSYNNYGQTESRNGDKTEGSYFVLLPDGRLQTVKYTVNGESGYVAEVTYSGEPKYEASYRKPVYQPAPYPA